MKKQRKHPMEILWICMALMCMIIAIIRTVKFGIDEAKAMYVFSILSALMYLWRRHLRKKEEEKDDTKKQ
jgi:4-hydroxybenzoate polyprenyltransferase